MQRNENRLASLDPLVLQEFEFLKNFVARVVSLRPNILLVEKTVSRLAQDMLLQHGITLVLNVKPVSTLNVIAGNQKSLQSYLKVAYLAGT